MPEFKHQLHSRLLAVALCMSCLAADAQLLVQLDDWQWGEWRFASLQVESEPGSWVLNLDGASWLSNQLGRVQLQCLQGHWSWGLPECRDGIVNILPADAGGNNPEQAASFSGHFSMLADTGQWQLELPGLELQSSLQAAGGSERHWRLILSGFDLSMLTRMLAVSETIPALQSGTATGTIELQGTTAELDIQLMGLAFDNATGDIAAADLQLDVNGALQQLQPSGWQFSLRNQWIAGELLFGKHYFPSPLQPVQFTLDGNLSSSEEQRLLQLDHIEWLHPQVLELTANADWKIGISSTGWLQALTGQLPQRWAIEHAELWLEPFQQAYISGVLGGLSMSQLQTSGKLSLTSTGLHSAGSRQSETSLQLQSINVSDPQGRLAIENLHGSIDWPVNTEQQAVLPNPTQSQLGWDLLSVYKLPIAKTQLQFGLYNDEFLLQPESHIPILDGGLALHQLAVHDVRDTVSQVEMQAEIVPISLRQLGSVMGWPQFGGELAGAFPGITRRDGVWGLDGQLEFSVFSGQVLVSDVSIERPFGVLPSLNASIWIDRIQLEQLTQAYDIGRITGPVDGSINNLRLLDWQPVQFDAWLRTSQNSQTKRRISQRAVDTLSSVGGGIGGGLQATVLRLFEDFSYKQLGISCTLRNGVCNMGGIEDRGNQFVIVAGSGIPRLDVIGTNRRVDWPQMLRQLKAAIQSEGPSVGSKTK